MTTIGCGASHGIESSRNSQGMTSFQPVQVSCTKSRSQRSSIVTFSNTIDYLLASVACLQHTQPLPVSTEPMHGVRPHRLVHKPEVTAESSCQGHIQRTACINSLQHIQPLADRMPKHRLAYGFSRRAVLAPVSNIMSMASGAQSALRHEILPTKCCLRQSCHDAFYEMCRKHSCHSIECGRA